MQSTRPLVRPLVRLLVGLFCLGSANLAMAQPSAKQQLAEENKQIAARYNADRKLCAEESESAARLQCLRDAKTERDKAMKIAKDKHKSGATAVADGKNACPDCGKVTAVSVKKQKGEAGAVGLIAGGVAGALLGNQVGSGSGKDAATIAGAAGGAIIGNQIEKKVNTVQVWEVVVRFGNGNNSTFTFKQDPGFAVGDVVAPSGTSIVKR